MATFGFNRTALRATQPKLHSIFCSLFLKIALSPETIDALKDNIREAICELQLHTIDNVFKNWTDRVGHCMASGGSHLNEIIFHY